MKRLILIFLVLISFSCKAQFLGLNQNSDNFATGLLSYYKMDDVSGNMIDEVNSMDFTVTGATQGQTGILGDCYWFDGIDDLCSGASPVRNATGDSVTLAIWVKFDTIHVNQAIMQIWSSRSATTNYVGHMLRKVDGSNFDHITVGVQKSGSSSGVLISGTSLIKDTWYLVVERLDISAGTSSTYKGNVNKTDAETSGGGTVTSFNTDGSAYVGRDYISRYFLEGWVDNVAMWDYWLTDEQISRYYNNGNGVEITGY